MDELEIKLDEANELLFSVVIEGTSEKPSSIRFVCEDKDMSYMFNGTPGEEKGEISVIIPPMQKHLKEGSYESRLEVLIEGKYISPLQVKTRFKNTLKVVSEVVRVKRPELKVTASANVVATPVVKPLVRVQESPVRLRDKLVVEEVAEKPQKIVKESALPPKKQVTQKPVAKLGKDDAVLLRNMIRSMLNKEKGS